MKPNDKAIEAGYEASANSANGSVFGRVSRSTMKEILTAAYAAQFKSEDYAELVKELRKWKDWAAKFNAVSSHGLMMLAQAADEITRLRADLAAVTAERNRMQNAFEKAVNDMRPMLRSMISRNEAAEIVRRAARAELEGVTEPATPWRDIESAPKDGTWIFIYKNNWPVAIEAKWDEIDDRDAVCMGWVFQDEFYYIGVATGCLGYNEDIKDGHMPTHWMPLPEPPR